MKSEIIPYAEFRRLLEKDLILQAIANLRQANIDWFLACMPGAGKEPQGFKITPKEKNDGAV